MTIGMNYIWKIQEIEGVKIKLQIWDTAGQEKYKTITKNYYRNSDGAIIGFAIDSYDSFCSVSMNLVLQGYRELDWRVDGDCKRKYANFVGRNKG